MQKVIKPLLILIALVGLAALVYVFVIKGQGASPTESLARTAANGTALPLVPKSENKQSINVAEDVEKFKKLLDQLNTIKLSTGVFQNKQYPNLVDNTALALEELDRIKNEGTLGKDNPFLGFENIVPAIVLQGSAAPTTPKPRIVTPRR